MFDLVVSKKAKEEWLNAYDFYEARQTGLGERFSSVLEYYFLIVEQTPLSFKKITKRNNAVLAKPFPFLIIYRIDDKKNTVVVLSIFHVKRNAKKRH